MKKLNTKWNHHTQMEVCVVFVSSQFQNVNATRERFERVEMSVAKIDLVEGLELIERCFGNSHA